MSERSGEGAAGVGFPWASVFDPVANARALEQIQRRGLKAAGELVDRLVSAVDGDRDFDAVMTNGESHGTRSTGSAASDLVGVWADLVTRTLQAMARLSVPDAGGPVQPTGGPLWVDVTNGSGCHTVALSVNGTDTPAGSVELWLHNPSQRSVGPVQLHMSELRSAEGATLPATVVHLDPEGIGQLPPRSSRGISVSIGSTARLPVGRYRGLLQAAGAPEVALSIELTVTGAT